MGLSVVAAHVVLFIALVSVGTVLVSAATQSLGDQIDAQAETIHRLQRAQNERFTLASEQYIPGPGRVETEWTNDGSDPILLDDITLLIDGVVTAHASSSIVTFSVKETPASGIWMPGETLEYDVDVNANVDLAIVGPYGTMGFRRA